jgi:hypothetical protein
MHALFPPREPEQHTPVRPPMIYIEKPLKWEYKQITRSLADEKPLDKTELNVLGEDGWEMTGVAKYESLVHYYLKRQRED